MSAAKDTPPREAARVVTLGCRLNTFESEVIREQAQAAGVTDAVIVNTCAVTAEAERQSRQTIRRLRREQPKARIIVTGCAAQIAPEKFAGMDEVDRVVGNAEKLDMKVLSGKDPALAFSGILAGDGAGGEAGANFTAPILGGFKDRTRAFVQVQQGCGHRCSFCIVPFARGPNHSAPEARIIEQARRLAANGHREIVLTGADVSSYGVDVNGRPGLGHLAGRLLRDVPELERLRLTSLDPAIWDDALFELLTEEPRFMPHLHLSLQSGSDVILKRMKRRHSRASALDLCNRARRARPGVTFGADLIAGFPTETGAMFGETLSAIEDFGLTYLHVFPYSKRPGVAAARMPQVPARERKRRAAALRQAGDRALARYLESQVGAQARVLVEKDRRGHSAHFAPVSLAFDSTPGVILDVNVTAVEDGRLIGEKPT
ncbi:MAG TPA: tRNA (N(6)-L-threonylcarbamoyladenosine(37)-C(2))-methylthiotransferase MtaB [Rhodospirillales bacterium]|nr:tRNA (N(6)-L-threonylcarbamoyladenosine(37)-C(2))-methylthiotransferase MtaB [Rhodospirillales bacterium]